MKEREEVHTWQFRKEYPLISNVEYWSRRMFRESLAHHQKKDTAINLGQKVFHGVSATQMRRFAMMLKGIALKLKEEGHGSVKQERGAGTDELV